MFQVQCHLQHERSSRTSRKRNPGGTTTRKDQSACEKSAPRISLRFECHDSRRSGPKFVTTFAHITLVCSTRKKHYKEESIRSCH